MQCLALQTSAVDLHGLTLSFETPNASLAERFEAVYGHLPPVDAAAAGVSIHWQLHPESVAPAPPANMPPILEEELVSYYGQGQQVAIRMPKYGLITVDLNRNHLTGQVTRNCLEVYGAFEDVMMISLAPLYRRRGWFPLHAFAALAPNGRAALITGAMGAGKTTTGLALLAAGWKLLSNDSPLLRLKDSRIEVLAYPGRLSAFDDSLARFESLRRFIPTDITAQPQVNPPKRVFKAEDVFANPWALAGEAGGVFFPQVVPGLTHSDLVEVPTTQAVLQLIPQAIEGWDKSAVTQNLHLLTTLVQQAPCYTLRLSPHVEQLPPLLAGAMND